MGTKRRILTVTTSVAVLLAGSVVVTPPTTAARPAALAASPAKCGAKDRPETGIQGDVPLADQLSGRAQEGYSCGLALVGYTSLGGRGQNGNMAWSGRCAYIAGDGIAIVDVSKPTAPKYVGTLTTPGSVDSLETLATVDIAGRHLLAAGRYGLFFDLQGESTAPVDLFDVTDCTKPKLLSSIRVPPSVHNLTFSPDGKRLWSTLPLQSYDVSDPKRPVYEGNLEPALQAQGLQQLEYAHEAMPSPDGTLLYIGGQFPTDERSSTIDVRGWPKQAPKVVATYTGPGHSIRPATIDGKAYLVRSEESVVVPTGNSCVPSDLTPFGGVAQAFLTDVSDQAHPKDAGTLGLAIDEPAHCPDALLSGVNTSSHYQDVDDPRDTTFAMVSMWHAGLRIFDLRTPSAPKEVAYFNPGQFGSTVGQQGPTILDTLLNNLSLRSLDQAWSHTRYDKATGHVWLATRTGGFWVLELEPHVRQALDLPAKKALHPQGGPARPAASQAVRIAAVDTRPSAIYCTLGKL